MRLTIPTALVVVATLAVPALAQETRPAPRFEDYPAAEIYREAPAPLDIQNTRPWRSQRSLLRKAASAGPNFAGGYTIASWACGHRCQQILVLDARTGKAVGEIKTRTGAHYRLDSTLLIANPKQSIPRGDEKTTTVYYVWQEGEFTKVGTP